MVHFLAWSASVLLMSSLVSTGVYGTLGQTATCYESDVGFGACGVINPNTKHTIAVSSQIFSTAMCGREVEISYNGITVQAIVQDSCPGCDPSHIDMAPVLFYELYYPQLDAQYYSQYCPTTWLIHFPSRTDPKYVQFWSDPGHMNLDWKFISGSGIQAPDATTTTATPTATILDAGSKVITIKPQVSETVKPVFSHRCHHKSHKKCRRHHAKLLVTA